MPCQPIDWSSQHTERLWNYRAYFLPEYLKQYYWFKSHRIIIDQLLTFVVHNNCTDNTFMGCNSFQCFFNFLWLNWNELWNKWFMVWIYLENFHNFYSYHFCWNQEPNISLYAMQIIQFFFVAMIWWNDINNQTNVKQKRKTIEIGIRCCERVSVCECVKWINNEQKRWVIFLMDFSSRFWMKRNSSDALLLSSDLKFYFMIKFSSKKVNFH